MSKAHPLLFLGLGGTGGKVLGVIQSTIARRLRAVGIHQIPKGFQFLHIDVPAQRDAEEGGYAFALSPTDYLPLTQANSTYTPTYKDLRYRLSQDRAFASWAPLPGTVPEATAPGAAQIRAYGRVIALGRLETIYAEIKARLVAARNGVDQLNPALAALGVAGLQEPATQPRVVVISSLAGGSGAGLVPDILDVLQTLSDNFPLITLLSPDVFSGSGAGNPGWAPNSLAALCELIAQDYSCGASNPNTDYTPTRHQIFDEKGLPGATASGAAAYFLVGASSQNGVVFTRPQDVFRVMGSMYAELALNPGLLDPVFAYLMTNYIARKAAAPDRLGITSNDVHDNPNLMGLGFGRLSIGREFFAQYTHQRFLRLVTDQLLEAHLHAPTADRDKGDEVLLAEAVKLHYRSFAHDLNLNELDPTGTRRNSTDGDTQDDEIQDHDQILKQVSILETEQYKALMVEFSGKLTRDIVAGARGNKVSTAEAYRTGRASAELEMGVAEPMEGDVDGVYLPMRSRARNQYLKRIPAFERRAASRLIERIPHWVAAVGLPVVIGMLQQLRQELISAAQQLEAQSGYVAEEALGSLAELEQSGLGMPRSFRKDNYPLIDEVVGDAWSPIHAIIYSDELKNTHTLVADLARNLIGPWLETLKAVRDGLDARVNAQLPGGGTLRQVWPSENGGVPSHLQPSPVEFTLESIDEFPEVFLQQVAARMPSLLDDLETELQGSEYSQRIALEDAIRDLITGMKDDLTTEGRTQWTAEPVAREAGQWISKLRDAARARPAVVRLALTLEDIDNRIIDWLNDPNAGTRDYLHCALREYLNPPADTITDEELRQRHDTMVAQFTNLLQAAKPLVNLNQSLYGEIHGPEIGYSSMLGAVDVPTLAPSLQTRLGTQPLAERLQAVMTQIMPTEQLSTNGSPAPSITMLTSTAQPFHLLVANSVMEPVSGSPDAANPTGWRNRRARPLAETVPLSPETLHALLLGLFAGRLMGQVELQGYSGDSIRVRDDKGNWMTVNLAGLRPKHSTDPHRDYPGRFLESYIPALVAAARAGSLLPLEPYRRLHELGKRIMDHTRPLHQWVMQGQAFPHTEDVFLLQPADTPEERSTQLRKACEDLTRAMTRVGELSTTPDARNLTTLDVLELAVAAITELGKQATIEYERF